MPLLPTFAKSEINNFIEDYKDFKRSQKRRQFKINSLWDGDLNTNIKNLSKRSENKGPLNMTDILACLYPDGGTIPTSDQPSFNRVYAPILRQLLRHDQFKENYPAVENLHKALTQASQDHKTKNCETDKDITQILCQYAPLTPIGLHQFLKGIDTSETLRATICQFTPDKDPNRSKVITQIQDIIDSDYNIAQKLQNANPQFLPRELTVSLPQTSLQIEQNQAPQTIGDIVETIKQKSSDLNELNQYLTNLKQSLNQVKRSDSTQIQRMVVNQIIQSKVLDKAIDNDHDELLTSALDLSQDHLDLFTGGYNKELLLKAYTHNKRKSEPSQASHILINYGLHELYSLDNPSVERAVFSGGGAKGITLPGAYKALSHTGVLDDIKQVSGASAGAITAAFAASGIDPQSMTDIIQRTDLKSLLGHFSLEKTGGFKTGKPLLAFARKELTKSFQDKLNNLLGNNSDAPQQVRNLKTKIDQYLAKMPEAADWSTIDSHDKAAVKKAKAQDQAQENYLIENPSPVQFKDLKTINDKCSEQGIKAPFKELFLTAAYKETREQQVFSSESTPDVEIALACRASASIPAVLQPVDIKINGTNHTFVDGGYIDNMPSDVFEDKAQTYNIDNLLRTLNFSFGEGKDPHSQENATHTALYGSENQRDPYHASMGQKLGRDVAIPTLGGIGGSGKATEDKNAGYLKLKDLYPHRSIDLHTGAISTMAFKIANQQATFRENLAFVATVQHALAYGYLEPSDNKVEQQFYDQAEQNFYQVIVDHFNEKLPETQDKPKTTYQFKNENDHTEVKTKSYIDQLNDIIEFVEKDIQKNLESPAVKAFNNAVTYYQQNHANDFKPSEQRLEIVAAMNQAIDQAPKTHQEQLQSYRDQVINGNDLTTTLEQWTSWLGSSKPEKTQDDASNKFNTSHGQQGVFANANKSPLDNAKETFFKKLSPQTYDDLYKSLNPSAKDSHTSPAQNPDEDLPKEPDNINPHRRNSM